MKKLFIVSALLMSAASLHGMKPHTDFYKKNPAGCLASLQVEKNSEILNYADCELQGQAAKLAQKKNTVKGFYISRHRVAAVYSGLWAAGQFACGCGALKIAKLAGEQEKWAAFMAFLGVGGVLGWYAISNAGTLGHHVDKAWDYDQHVANRQERTKSMRTALESNPNWQATEEAAE